MYIKDRLIRFMQGRYGADEYVRFLNGAGFISLLIALVFTIISSGLAAKHPVGSIVFRVLYFVFYIFGIVLIVYCMVRMFSRNTDKRHAENTRFLYKKTAIQRKWRILVDRWENRKIYHYLKCPKCGQALRVPKNKGKIRITCSKCGEHFIIHS